MNGPRPQRQYGNRKRTKASLRVDEVMRRCWTRKPSSDEQPPQDLDGGAA